MSEVSLLGLGRMGTAMATRILAAGIPLTVYNRTHNKTQPLAEKGAKVATTIKEAVANADIIISCFLDDNAVTENTFGDKRQKRNQLLRV